MLNTILTNVLIIVLVALATSVTGAIVTWVKRETAQLAKSEPLWFGDIMQVATAAVQAAEQSGLAGLIKNESTIKKQYALQVAQAWLDAKGVKIDLQVIDAAIESAVLTEFGKDTQPALAADKNGAE